MSLEKKEGSRWHICTDFAKKMHSPECQPEQLRLTVSQHSDIASRTGGGIRLNFNELIQKDSLEKLSKPVEQSFRLQVG